MDLLASGLSTPDRVNDNYDRSDNDCQHDGGTSEDYEVGDTHFGLTIEIDLKRDSPTTTSGPLW